MKLSNIWQNFQKVLDYYEKNDVNGYQEIIKHFDDKMSFIGNYNDLLKFILNDFCNKPLFAVIFDYTDVEVNSIDTIINSSIDVVVNKLTFDLTGQIFGVNMWNEKTYVADDSEDSVDEDTILQQEVMQQKIEEDEDEVVETKKNYTDAQIAKSMNITLDQLFTLRKLKDNSPFSFKTPYKYKDRKRKTILESKKGTFYHFSELFNKGYVSVCETSSGNMFSMKAKEFFTKTSVRTLKYEGPETDLSSVEPTEADIEKIKKYGEYEYSYTPGGYPSSARFIFNQKLSDKILKSIENIKTREIAIKMTKAYIQVFGSMGRSALLEFKIKCKQLGCTDTELETLENYTTRLDLKISYRA